MREEKPIKSRSSRNPTVLSISKGGPYQRYVKRLLDFTLSLLAIVVLSPIIILIAVLIRVRMGTPVLLKQQRPGLNEMIFTIYKFRTMTNEKDEHDELLPDSVRLTKLGHLLRIASLDELPELFNIIKGDMSLIGPRPLAVQYLPYYTAEERRRHDVRPGLSGLAQIRGRNTLQWEQKFAYDIEYVHEITLLKDCRIIFETLFKTFKREGVTVRGTTEISDFDKYRESQNAKNTMREE